MRVVEALTVFSVPGLIIATLVFFITNRLLPLDASLAGYGRAALEMGAFYLAWLATLAHAALRKRAAWREQAWGLAGLALLAVMLNWATTGQHLAHTLGHGLWAVAGMDLALLVAAGLAAVTARHLTRKAAHAQRSMTAAPQAALSANGSTSHA
ncbi:hypothetical protein LP414_02190 [Polaromonas sp. P1(28)-13]|nr:hypothetical protein LP414_02190 [Polaromonas sp. P1(28)-13]